MQQPIRGETSHGQTNRQTGAEVESKTAAAGAGGRRKEIKMGKGERRGWGMEGAEVIVKTSRRDQKIKMQFQFNYPYTFP